MQKTSGWHLPPHPSFPRSVLFKYPVEYRFTKIRPVGIDEKKLTVGSLPQKEIREALFAAGADDEIRIGHISSPQVFLERLFGDLLTGRCEFLRSRCDLLAAAV